MLGQLHSHLQARARLSRVGQRSGTDARICTNHRKKCLSHLGQPTWDGCALAPLPGCPVPGLFIGGGTAGQLCAAHPKNPPAHLVKNPLQKPLVGASQTDAATILFLSIWPLLLSPRHNCISAVAYRWAALLVITAKEAYMPKPHAHTARLGIELGIANDLSGSV